MPGGLALGEHALLFAEFGDDRRLQRLGGRACTRVAGPLLLDLVDLRLQGRYAVLRRGELRVGLVELLFRDDLAGRHDDVVSHAVALNRVLGVLHPSALLVEASRQRSRRLFGRLGSRLGLIGEIGVGNGVGELRCLLGALRRDGDVDDQHLVGAPHGKPLAQGFECPFLDLARGSDRRLMPEIAPRNPTSRLTRSGPLNSGSSLKCVAAMALDKTLLDWTTLA